MEAPFNATNVTSTVNSNAAKIMIRNTILLVVAALVVLLNGLCFITLLRDKRLKSKRFEMMTICLSISDILFGVVKLASTTKNLANINVPFYCYVVYSIAQATMTYSMLQMIMICIDRLLATFPTVRNPFLKIPVFPLNFSLGLACMIVVFPLFAEISDVWAMSCNIYAMAENGLLLGYGVFQPLHLFLAIVILVAYAITIYRVYSSWKIITKTYGQQQLPTSKIGTTPNEPNYYKKKAMHTNGSKTFPVDGETSSRSYQPQGNVAFGNKIRQMSQMAVTLGMLIVVLIVTWMPRILLGHWFLIDPEGYLADLDGVVVAEMIVNASPFFNPLIYVLRIRRFREKLFGCCITFQSSSSNQETTVTKTSKARL